MTDSTAEDALIDTEQAGRLAILSQVADLAKQTALDCTPGELLAIAEWIHSGVITDTDITDIEEETE